MECQPSSPKLKVTVLAILMGYQTGVSTFLFILRVQSQSRGTPQQAHRPHRHRDHRSHALVYSPSSPDRTQCSTTRRWPAEHAHRRTADGVEDPRPDLPTRLPQRRPDTDDGRQNSAFTPRKTGRRKTRTVYTPSKPPLRPAQQTQPLPPRTPRRIRRHLRPSPTAMAPSRKSATHRQRTQPARYMYTRGTQARRQLTRIRGVASGFACTRTHTPAVRRRLRNAYRSGATARARARPAHGQRPWGSRIAGQELPGAAARTFLGGKGREERVDEWRERR